MQSRTLCNVPGVLDLEYAMATVLISIWYALNNLLHISRLKPATGYVMLSFITNTAETWPLPITPQPAPKRS